MTHVYVARELEKGESAPWDHLVATHPLGRGMVTTASRNRWGLYRWSFHPIGLFRDSQLTGGLAMVTKRLPATPWRLARIEALMVNSSDVMESTHVLLEGAIRIAHEYHCAEVEVRLYIPEQFNLGGIDYTVTMRHSLADNGYRDETYRPATYLVQLDMDDEQLLGSYSSKCRRDVRKGLREGVTVEELRATEDLRVFLGARHEMAIRKGIEDLSGLAYDGFLPMFEQGYCRLFAARYKERICNMALIDALGIPRYLLGATTAAAFEKGVPPTGQPLHYGIMRCLRDQGAHLYDLGGSPGPLPVQGHPNYTVWRFKYEFGAPYVYMLPCHRKSLSKVGTLLLATIRRFRGLS